MDISDLTPEQLAELDNQREQLERQALFATCVSKEHLHFWIKRYLGIDLPDTIVCDDDVTNPPSNSSPLDLIWEIYQKALDGTDEDFQRVLAYAARDSFKTLSASILEVLCLFHLRRNVAHMAAIESQAGKAASYLSRYLQRPYLRDYVEGNNKREIRVTRYDGVDGDIITPAEFKALDFKTQRKYEPVSHYMKIIIATLSGANSEHVSFMVLDELDLAPEAPLNEAKFIPAPGEVRGELPITFMTSSRKFAIGNVQKEIDKAQKDPTNKLQIRHWNILDVTERCPPTRHLPDEPKIPIYYNENNLRAISEEDWNLLTPEERSKYFKQEGYTGCLKRCSLFAACRGRLATKQKAADPSAKPRSMLKPIAHVTNLFKDASVELVKAQLMCWKPSSEGLIYPNFNYARHMLDTIDMYEKITGEKIPRKTDDGKIHPEFIRFSQYFTKAKLIEFMIERGMEWYSGMDFGYTHNWAVVTGARDGNRFFVVDVIAIAGLELAEKIDVAKDKLTRFPNLTIFPDVAYPADIATFRKHGFVMRKTNKDVIGGIEAVRMKIMPGIGKDPELFFLAGDEGCELLAHRMTQYHWKLDANESPTNIPDDKDDDECDALRYVIANLYGTRGKFSAAVAGVSPHVNYDPNFPLPFTQGPGIQRERVPGLTVHEEERILEPTVDNWMQYKISELTRHQQTEEMPSEPKVHKRGGFVFDI